MQDINNNDRLLSQLMQKSRLEMPFSDFEETVMLRIQKESSLEKLVMRDRKLSFFFFIAGTCLGLILNTILQKSRYTLLNIPSDTTLLIFQAGFVLLFIVQFDRNFPFLKQWKNQKRI